MLVFPEALAPKIKEIFFLPNLDTPVQIEAYDMLKNNPIQYEKLAKELSKNTEEREKANKEE